MPKTPEHDDKDEELEIVVEEDENPDEGENVSDDSDAEAPLKDLAKKKKPESDEDDEAEDDKRTAADSEEDDNDNEATLERRRKEKRERKDRRDRAIARDKLEMDFLRKRNEELEKRMLTQEMRAHRQDHYTVEQRIAEAEKEARLAEDVMAKAIAEANGDDAARALRFRDEALDKIRQLSYERENLKKTEESAKTPKNVADPVVNSYAKTWIGKNPWYDVNGGDEDSRIVLEIDTRLAAEGYVPRTELYWKELDRRVRRNLPHRYESASRSSSDDNDSEEYDDDEDSPAPSRSRTNLAKGKDRKNGADDTDSVSTSRGAKKGPPVGNNREHAPASTRKEIYISKERKEALIAAGVWDDPVLRTKYVKQYQKWDKENATR